MNFGNWTYHAFFIALDYLRFFPIDSVSKDYEICYKYTYEGSKKRYNRSNYYWILRTIPFSGDTGSPECCVQNNSSALENVREFL